MKLLSSKWILFLAIAAAAVWALAFRLPRSAAGFDLAGFGRLPALLSGRIQPLDSVARNSLLQIRERQTVLLDDKSSMPATAWLAEALLRPDLADQRKIFRIVHPELKSMLLIPSSEKFFSFQQIRPRILELEKDARRINEKEAQLRTPFEGQVSKLYNAVMVYHRLRMSVKPESATDFAADLKRFQAAVPAGVAAFRAREAGKEFSQGDFDTLLEFLRPYNDLAQFGLAFVPPARDGADKSEWTSIGRQLLEVIHDTPVHPAVQYFAAMSTAYQQNRPAEFNQAIADYRQWLSQHYAREARKARSEFFFNAFQPFYKSLVLYVAAFILAAWFWVNGSHSLRRVAVGLILVSFAVHTFGLIFRMVLEGRPPVTNLYSSAIFIGWGAVLLGVVLERFYRDGIGAVTAAAIGFCTLVIAHNLAMSGDTMEMLRAVLDTNFWLATHVTTVTLGYAATFVAGFLALLYLVRGALTRSLTESSARALGRMVYGIICFATLFSFVGTVLGGIWADQSWGRFWGWDPKENGAVMIVIWNAAYLHARWGKIFPERHLMAMAVFGNIVTSFSWFGVNMLGIGLHSYGFMDQAFKWLMAFDISQLLVIVLAFLPLKHWRSPLTSPGRTPASASKTVAREPVSAAR